MGNRAEIGVVIVSLNGKEYLKQLMPSLLAQDHHALDIVIIDNGSNDGTVDWIIKNHPMVKVFTFPENLGFALPNNCGISYLLKNSNIKYIACINNDTVLPDDFFSRMTLFAEKHEGSIGAIQTKIVSFEHPAIIDSVGITIDYSMSAINEGQNEIDNGQFELPREIFGATGSAAVYTRDAIEALLQNHGECFDSDFFAYQDDVDLAFRLRMLGFSAWYVPGPPVLHVHSGTGKNYSPFKSYHIHRNTLYMIIKNLPGTLVFTGIFNFIRKYSALIGSLKKKQGPSYELSKKTSFPAMMIIVLKAWVMVMLRVPFLVIKRHKIQKTKKASSDEVKRWFEDYRADTDKMTYGLR